MAHKTLPRFMSHFSFLLPSKRHGHPLAGPSRRNAPRHPANRSINILAIRNKSDSVQFLLRHKRLTKSKHESIYTALDLLLRAGRSPAFYRASPGSGTERKHIPTRHERMGPAMPVQVRGRHLFRSPSVTPPGHFAFIQRVFNFEQTATPFISPAIPFIRILIISFFPLRVFRIYRL
jgi:hypothetical protein